ncbi:MAG: ribonuclease III [Candidatus Melainabacteria bacterium GWF2_32_7]|nr:MAG: ribonuclease III [Candidatus Melainabacteria bacterium GWF2_32_7]
MINKKRKADINELLQKLHIESQDYERLDTALTHSSYTFENKIPSLENNERLEFLGDAVLKLIASDYLQERFPDYTEGELTKIRAILISDATLTKIANKIDLGKHLKLGYHEEKSGGRKRASTLACAFEALLGALYLDGKLKDLQNLIVQLFEDEVTEIDQSVSKYNFKAMLQEYTQANGLELPIYSVIKEEGPPHNKMFEIGVIINEKPLGIGSGKSKKEAQQKSAEMAVIELGLLDQEEKSE